MIYWNISLTKGNTVKSDIHKWEKINCIYVSSKLYDSSKNGHSFPNLLLCIIYIYILVFFLIFPLSFAVSDRQRSLLMTSPFQKLGHSSFGDLSISCQSFTGEVTDIFLNSTWRKINMLSMKFLYIYNIYKQNIYIMFIYNIYFRCPR